MTATLDVRIQLWALIEILSNTSWAKTLCSGPRNPVISADASIASAQHKETSSRPVSRESRLGVPHTSDSLADVMLKLAVGAHRALTPPSAPHGRTVPGQCRPGHARRVRGASAVTGGRDGQVRHGRAATSTGHAARLAVTGRAPRP